MPGKSLGLSRLLTLMFAVLVLSFVIYTGLRRLEVGSAPGPNAESATAEAATRPANQPALLSVSNDQLAHLTIVDAKKVTWPVDVQTTGTVDWDADHTTQAITQVNGPISRILVDLGTPVKGREPLALRVEPRRRQCGLRRIERRRNREGLHETHRWTAQKELLDQRRRRRKRIMKAMSPITTTPPPTSKTASRRSRSSASRNRRWTMRSNRANPSLPNLPFARRSTGAVIQKLVSPGQFIQAGATACFMLSNTCDGVGAGAHLRPRPSVHSRWAIEVEETNAAFDRTLSRDGLLYRRVRGSGDANHAGAHRDRESSGAAEERHVRQCSDPHRHAEQRDRRPGGGRAAGRAKRAARLCARANPASSRNAR